VHILHEPAQTAHAGDTPARCIPLPLLGCHRLPQHTQRASTRMVSMRHMLGSRNHIRRCRGHYCASRRSADRCSIAPCGAAPHLLHTAPRPGRLLPALHGFPALPTTLTLGRRPSPTSAAAAPAAALSACARSAALRLQRPRGAQARAAGRHRAHPHPRHCPRQCRPARCPLRRSSSCRR